MSEEGPPESERNDLRATDRLVRSHLPPVEAVRRGSLEAWAEQRGQIVALSSANRARAEIIDDLTSEVAALVAERDQLKDIVDQIRARYGIRVEDDGMITFSATRYLRVGAGRAVRSVRRRGRR